MALPPPPRVRRVRVVVGGFALHPPSDPLAGGSRLVGETGPLTARCRGGRTRGTVLLWSPRGSGADLVRRTLVDPYAARPSGAAVAPPPPAAPAAPPRRRRWGRRLLLLALVLVLLVALSPLALSLPFVRNLVAEKASAAVGKTVRIERASAFWGKGIDLGGVV